MRKEVRGLKWSARPEGTGMMLGAILIAALLLWTTTMLSPYVLPPLFGGDREGQGRGGVLPGD
jgi:hypothetical protein